MDAIDELLTRGVDQIYPNRESLENILRSGKKLRLYQGFDPTGKQLHIGHAVAIRKLRQFQDLGHHVIFLIGDGTGQAGDPSGKKTARSTFFSNKELRANAKDYVTQAGKIVRFTGSNPVEILYNSEWLNKLRLVDILNIASHFTIQQMMERDLYRERLRTNIELSFREFMYPLLQGYDSVAMNVDLELGGTDQTFNMLAGRQLEKQMLQKEKFVMTVPLLTDSKGIKIGKTEGNAIALTDKPNEFYAKIMALGDDAIIPCFTLLTDKPLDQIQKIKQDITNGENPMKYKKQLAYTLTSWLNNDLEAQRAQDEFETVHQQKHIESVTAPIFQTQKEEWELVDLLVETHLVESKSEIKRLIEQHAVDVDGVQAAIDARIFIHDGSIIRVGKKKFIRVKIV